MREGEFSRSTTRSALVFCLAGAIGLAYLASRTTAITSLLDTTASLTQPPSVATSATGTEGEAQTEVGERPQYVSQAGPSRSSEILASQGMVLEQITVNGRVLSAPEDLIDAVGAAQGSPLMAIDPAQVRARLLTLPWVKSARVERRLPAELHLEITEREPMALWQHNGAYAVIDRQGNAVNVDPGAWSSLPLVVGKGAAGQAADLLNLLTTQPAIAARVKAAILVGERRWTLRLDDMERGLTLRLPAQDPAEALAKVAELDAQDGLLSKDLAMIDMRLPGRLVVRLVDRSGKGSEADELDEGASSTGPAVGPARSGSQPRGEGRDA
ncbi:cell division protein FtsQ/DivIB [Rhodospirillum sp. A1_3_36]|uniref:cell division protein FtsQ/DivIB n=1 Tax=Rhodospirillum sp. A1_3_36 TaxID=3391666 RepID=UPI0039A53AB2